MPSAMRAWTNAGSDKRGTRSKNLGSSGSARGRPPLHRRQGNATSRATSARRACASITFQARSTMTAPESAPARASGGFARPRKPGRQAGGLRSGSACLVSTKKEKPRACRGEGEFREAGRKSLRVASSIDLSACDLAVSRSDRSSPSSLVLWHPRPWLGLGVHQREARFEGSGVWLGCSIGLLSVLFLRDRIPGS
jgi:hypothetical protein